MAARPSVGLSRPGAAAAVLVFALSPLAVQFGRTVYLDNIAVAWTLAAFAFALSRRHQLASFAAAAVCFGIAVLTKETFLLLLPFLAWQLWRSAHPSTRRYTVSVAGALFALVVSFYIVYALVKNELVPGPDRVSLWDGIAFQLANRAGSGNVLDGATQAGRSVRGWLQLDPVLSVTAPIAAVLALWVRRLRPYGAALVFLLAVIFKPGYLPVPFVIGLVPLAALLVAGVADAAIRHWRGRWWRWPVRVLSLVVVVLAIGAAGVIWPPQLRSLWTYDLDRPLRQAESWVAANVDPGQRILTDDAVWLDLVHDGLPRRDVVWYYKADTDSEVIARAPHGWRDYDYVLVTEGMRHGIGDSAILSRAIGNATQVAAFGSGPAAVQVYQVHPVGVDEFYGDQYRAVHGRRFGGRVLLDNPRLELDRVAARQLRRGKVDGRIVTALAQELGHWRLSVSRFPAVAGETAKVPHRIIEITGVAGRPVARGGPQVAALAEQLRGLPSPYRPESVTRHGDHLTVRFEVAQPSDVLPQPPAQ